MVPNSVAAIMDATPMCVLKHEVSLCEIQKAIEFEIFQLSTRMNVTNNIRTEQIGFTAEAIITNYPVESLEDIILCLRRGSMGYYGSTYHQLDTSVILGWMALHIEEKCNYLERGASESKQTEKDIYVDYEAFKKKIEEKKREETARYILKREASILNFLDKSGSGRKAFNVPVEDSEGKPIGTVENVFADSYEGAQKIVLRMIEQGIIKL